ncbi:MAG: 7-cyano-7-deazaguanine synthase [Methanobacteriaceae archaeon]|nr:7-cyano-7-deazaguanine synthase [Methanobacteriaceae archaeon]
MNTAVLYSGGKDSSLMAVILDKLNYDIELVTVNFGVFNSWKPAKETAKSLGFKHKIIKLDKTILTTATEQIINDNFPNNGINYIHHQVLDTLAKKYDILADGTRREDKIPKLTHSEIQSLEDRNNLQYLNLTGIGYKTINDISDNLFKIQQEESNLNNSSDYEMEVRYLLQEQNQSICNIFPKHIQSRVIGWK